MFDRVFGDLAEMGIALLITALIISAIGLCTNLSHRFNEKQIESQAVAEAMQEQRNNIFYNHTHVYQQDVVSQVMRYRGTRSVRVQVSASPLIVYEWSLKTAPPTSYTISAISSKLPSDKAYDADLDYGPNGEVVGYIFAVCNNPAGCGR